MIWRPAYHRRIAQAADAVTTAFSFLLGYLVWNRLRLDFPAVFGREIDLTGDHFWLVAAVSVASVVVLSKMNAYAYQRFTSLGNEIKMVLKTGLIGTLLVFAAIFVLRVGYIARTYVFIFFISNVICLMLEKVLMFKVAKKIRESGRNRKKIIVLGNGTMAYGFVRIAEANLGWGLDIIGIVTLANGTEHREEIHGKPLLGRASEIQDVLHKHQVDEVIICASSNELGQVEAVLDVCEREGVQVRLNSDFFVRLAKKVSMDSIYGLPIISFVNVPDNEWALYAKRAMDFLIALIALVILAPAFFLIVLLIKLTSPGPIFYRWNVIGFNKKAFTSWKFRTMVVNADELKEQLVDRNEMSGPVFKIRDDPRITPVGKILRKYSLDELPQLFSVLKGDMSLVGPRPAGPHELTRYESWQRRKLSIKPGITCLWQASGRNNIRDFSEWCMLDLQYIDNWSLWLDIKILFKTATSVIRGTGC
jgi:exopolysaccharide biosynthesis polyprenyl glycosylphosphotransferase